MLTPFGELYRHRRLLAVTTLDSVKKRYLGTTFGMVWLVLFPLLFLSVYGGVFAFVLKVRLAHQSTFEYILMLFAGLIPFLAFSEMLSSSVSSVNSNRSLIKNTMFPLELIPVQDVLASTFRMLFSLLLLFAALWCSGFFFWQQILVIPIIILQMVFSCGIAWIFGALAVGFRDLTQLVGIITLVLMLGSPIGYTKEMIPQKMLVFMYFNPLYYLITLYRGVLLEQKIFWPELAAFTGIAFVFFYLGYTLFRRLKGAVFEYV